MSSDTCFICLEPPDLLDDNGMQYETHWMTCAHWLRMVCADENVEFMNLASKDNIKCGVYNMTGVACEANGFTHASARRNDRNIDSRGWACRCR